MQNLTGLYGVSKQDITQILDTAIVFKKSLLSPTEVKYNYLSGKTVVLGFFENSTRTRTSFDLAARRLGAGTVNFTAATSSIQKGETLRDTIATLEAMQVDAFVIRHRDSGAVEQVSRFTKKPVINAGDGMHEHPTQALLDMLTLHEVLGRIEGLKILILGDILHSRVARSNIFGLKTMGAKVSVCAPPTLLPAGIESFGVQIYNDLDKALEDVDAVVVLRLQLEREAGGYIPSIPEYTRFYGLTDERMERLKKKIYVLHPGPINREIELSNSVADRTDSDTLSDSRIISQVTNGVAVRMAVLKELLAPEA
ncbi:MAG: aspartate carbamoyltransferase catalytic subunit [Chlorobiales bacterium]|nr:aspartate carbamoyltransferase catalytic subunit [Chlorobiales bacterium]